MSDNDSVNPAAVVAFWTEAGPARWYAKSDAFDADIRSRFGSVHASARAGELDRWAESPEGALALLILLDQFSRNLFRGSPQAFAADQKALATADRAIGSGVDREVPLSLRQFIYLPFMHAETIAEQERSLALFHSLHDTENVRYAKIHEVIIRRFGRFPHRNAVLGRHTTPAEQAFLESGGFSG